MSDPADTMSGCMRGASDSRLNGAFGEGKLKELAATAVSSCSIDDCMMLLRAFNSAKAFFESLQTRGTVKLLQHGRDTWTHLSAEVGCDIVMR